MDWNAAVAGYLKTLTGGTRRQYELALTDFLGWYEQTYQAAPEPALLTNEELREWQTYLLEKEKLKAASVNQRLAAVKGLARHCGRRLEVKGVKRVADPIEPLNGRELGRLFAAAEGDSWQDARDVALLSLMARAGLRVAEVCALSKDDIVLSPRSGQVLVRRGKGQKERKIALALECRKEVAAYLSRRPDWPTDRLFFSKTGKDLATRDVERLVEKLAQLAGLERPVTPHTLRHSFGRPLGHLVNTSSDVIRGQERIFSPWRFCTPSNTELVSFQGT